MIATTARLDLRLGAAEKSHIAKATVVCGIAMCDGVLREADSTIAAQALVTLIQQESCAFLTTLDTPFHPNTCLRKAMNTANRVAVS